ncbi:hypothetical protein [Nakamurella endophytica]|uniref:hypothetical protein n=1 Tax=Nakamurella endophytica TaxID=1748367 RepID=UPI0016670EDD|nr:hypothetical protein [Nakamurella endophytica]
MTSRAPLADLPAYRPQQGQVDAACASPTPLWQLWTGRTGGQSLVRAYVVATGRTALRRTILSRLRVTVDEVLAGHPVRGTVDGYVWGGRAGSRVTTVNGTATSSWAADGSALVTLVPLTAADRLVTAIPVVGRAALFVPLGCLTASGYRTTTVDVDVVAFEDGVPTRLSGRFPAVGLDDLRRSLR